VKPLGEYYQRKGMRDGLYSWCKACHRTIARQYKATSRRIPGHPSEQTAIDALKAQGIFAVPGKATIWPNIDVVAWGCVRIEVKTSGLNGNSFRFGLGYKTKRRWHDCDIVLLICHWPEEPPTFHLFRATQPAFFNTDGTLKNGVSWTPNRHHRGPRNGVTLDDVMMHQGRDRWALVEEYRRAWVTANRSA